jgi:hypothetical protein
MTVPDPDDAQSSAILYARPLIDGGFVAIEAKAQSDASYRAQVYVERRTDPARRLGHAPPVVAEYEGPTRVSVLDELYVVAADNEVLARGIARWSGGVRVQPDEGHGEG